MQGYWLFVLVFGSVDERLVQPRGCFVGGWIVIGLLGLLGALLAGVIADSLVGNNEDASTTTDEEAVPDDQDQDLGPPSTDLMDPEPDDGENGESIAAQEGTDGVDFLSGHSGQDQLDGYGGGDELKGYAGDDSLFGGDGTDVLLGDEGGDNLSGGNDSDSLRGGDDDDTLWGDDGNDDLAGQMGNDQIFGGSGDDQGHGGEGDDNMSGEDGNDILMGDFGADTLIGGRGADDLAGGAGNDYLFGGDQHGLDDGESDTLNGQDGDDVLVLNAGDYGAGQEGADIFVLRDFTSDMPPAVITDFSEGEDSLVLIYDSQMHPSPDVTFEEDPDTGDATLVLDGVPLATILGGAGIDLSNIDIRAG
jgi:Ca2+-binding RTX toxin-like protein